MQTLRSSKQRPMQKGGQKVSGVRKLQILRSIGMYKVRRDAKERKKLMKILYLNIVVFFIYVLLTLYSVDFRVTDERTKIALGILVSFGAGIIISGIINILFVLYFM